MSNMHDAPGWRAASDGKSYPPPAPAAATTPAAPVASGGWVPTRKRAHYALTGWPIDVVAGGLRSDQVATRVAAAERLHQVNHHGHPEVVVEVAVPCLTDPVPAIRYHAIRALAHLSRFDKTRHESSKGEWLLSLLTSPDPAHAALKASVLKDIANVNGPASPFAGKAVSDLLCYTSGNDKTQYNILHDALVIAPTPAVALPILEALKAIDRLPELARSVGQGAQAIQWPDRCCGCGAPHPATMVPVRYRGTISSTVLMPGRGQVTVAEGTLTVPSCGRQECLPPKPRVWGVLTMRFTNPEFIAEALSLGSWHVHRP